MPTPESSPVQRRRANGRANQLSDAEKFLLWRELQAIKTELVTEGPSLVDVAARMTRSLGFAVTLSNIESAVEAGVVQWTPREVEERRDRLGQSLGLPQMRSTLEEVLARLTCLESEQEDEADGLESVRVQGDALGEEVSALSRRLVAVEERLEAIEAALTAPTPKACSTRPEAPAAAPPVVPSTRSLPVRLPPLPGPFAAALAQPVRPLTPELFHGAGLEQAWKCGSYHAIATVCVSPLGVLSWAVMLRHAEGCDAMNSSRRKILERVLNKAGRIVRRILRRVGTGEVLLREDFGGAAAVGLRPLSEAEAARARLDIAVG
jgi:hypothetical protein